MRPPGPAGENEDVVSEAPSEDDLETLATEWMFHASHFGLVAEILNGRWTNDQVADMARGVLALITQLRELRSANTPVQQFRAKAGMEPCWLVWEAAADGGRPYLLAVDTSEECADRHVHARREEARTLGKPPPMITIEQSWFNHRYGESMTKSFDTAKTMMREHLRAQVAELRTRLARAIELAREAAPTGWWGAKERERLDELAQLEKGLT